MDSNSLDSLDMPTSDSLGTPTSDSIDTPTSTSTPSQSSLESQSSPPASKSSSVTSFLPPCRICGGVASGFHYGANTCEACKAFFRRCTSKDYQSKTCPNNGGCTALVRGRLACVPCRMAQCLKAGMTKSASKKGRYTHERRTQYTKEIKGEEVTVKTEPQVRSPSPANTTFLEEKLKLINQLSTEYFPEMNSFMAQKEEIYNRIDKLVEEHCPGDIIPNQPIYAPGPTGQQLFKTFCDNLSDAVELKRAAAAINAATSTHLANQLPPSLKSQEYIPFSLNISDTPALYPPQVPEDSQVSPTSNGVHHSPPFVLEGEGQTWKDVKAVNLLWENWMMVAEILFVELTKFAKQLPGFNDLLLNDRIILLKGARVEVSTIMAHPSCRVDKHLICMFCEQTKELVLTPINMFPHGAFTTKFNDEHNIIMSRLLKANYTLEDVNVLIAFIVLSADREGLEEPAKVESLQDDMLQLLQYTLNKNHPKSPGKLAETLLILPDLREHSELMRRLLYAGKAELNPVLSPLIDEVL